MKRIAWLLLLFAAPALAAQAPTDTGRAARDRKTHEEFQRRRDARLRQVLDLTDNQTTKLEATEQKFGEQRRALMQRSHAIAEALRGQLRPGQAANADSVRKLLDASEQNGEAVAQLRRDQSREMAAYLSPVQRARLQLMRWRMMARFATGHRHGRMGHGSGRDWHRPGGRDGLGDG